jgi:anti-sigma regulatory factor (Ser/Thr protein kinase)
MKDIALHILDIAENSVRANATEITIELHERKNSEILLKLSDNGVGMNTELADNAHDPFYTTRTTRSIGMGLALLKQNAEQCGGSFAITSIQGKGTQVKVVFMSDHIDCPPLGDISGVISILMTSNPEIKINFLYIFEENQYFLDSFACQNVLGKEFFQHPIIITNLKQIIENGIINLNK